MNRKYRWVALDILKAVGILIVILSHIFFRWYYDKGYYNILIFNLIGIFVATIPITAGASLRFYMDKSFDKTRLRLKNKKVLSKKIIKRSILLIFLGYLMNYLTWGIEDIWDWDVLQFIGLGILYISVSLYFISLWFLVIFTCILFLFSSFIRTFLQSMYPENYLTIIFVGDTIGEHYFPFLPWIVFIVYGFLLAHYYIYLKQRKQKLNFSLYTPIVGIVLLFITFLSSDNPFFVPNPSNIWGPELMQPPISKVLFYAGLFTLSLVVIDIITSKIKKIRKYGFINTFSKGILWIFLLQNIIGFNLIKFLLNKGLNDSIFMISTMIFMSIFSYFIGMLVVWFKYDYKLKKKLSLV